MRCKIKYCGATTLRRASRIRNALKCCDDRRENGGFASFRHGRPPANRWDGVEGRRNLLEPSRIEGP